MTTEDIVKRLTELVGEGKNVQAEEELYADNVVSFEQDGRSAVGKDAVIAKTKAAGEYFEELYSAGVSEVFVRPDSFLLTFDMDFKPKGGERTQMKEYGFYRVEDGKIVEESFFASPLK